jgi:general secretion pathway protein B
MSFILDALKKSERERQRQTGPALFEVKAAPPRNRFPLWAVVIGALLVVNSGVIIWLLIHNSSKGSEAQAVAPGAVAAAPAAPANGAMNPGPAPYGQPPAGQSPWPPGPPPPYNTNTNTPPNAGSGGEYFGDPAGAAYGQPEQSQNEPAPATDASDEPRLKRNVSEDQVLNPEDYEPAAEAPRAAKSGAARKRPADDANSSKSEADGGSPEEQRARRAERGLPTYQDAAAMPGMNMPSLRLDLHVYDPEPEKSFALVNMQKVKPGETFAQGVHLDQITPSGAILSYRGVRFVLRSE